MPWKGRRIILESNLQWLRFNESWRQSDDKLSNLDGWLSVHLLLYIITMDNKRFSVERTLFSTFLLNYWFPKPCDSELLRFQWDWFGSAKVCLIALPITDILYLSFLSLCSESGKRSEIGLFVQRLSFIERARILQSFPPVTRRRCNGAPNCFAHGFRKNVV